MQQLGRWRSKTNYHKQITNFNENKCVPTWSIINQNEKVKTTEVLAQILNRKGRYRYRSTEIMLVSGKHKRLIETFKQRNHNRQSVACAGFFLRGAGAHTLHTQRECCEAVATMFGQNQKKGVAPAPSPAFKRNLLPIQVNERPL